MIQKTTKLCKRFNDEAKKINKNKEFDFNKKLSSVFERKKFINDIYRLKTKINLVNQIYMIQWKLQLINVDLLLSKFLNHHDWYCYNVYKLIYNIINFWKQHKECITLFYKVDFEDSNIIFDISILTNQNIIIHSMTSSWHFEINIKKFQLFEFKELVKDLKEQINIYAFVIANINMMTMKFKSLKISKDYLYLKELFDNEKARVLCKQNQ